MEPAMICAGSAPTTEFAQAPHLARARDAATAIEFALLLPFFVVLLYGIIAGGEMLFQQTALQHAVTEAARCAAIAATAGSSTDCGSVAQIQSFAASEAFGVAVAPDVFSVSTPTGLTCVAASDPYVLTIPFVPEMSLMLAARACDPS
jgi:Flp pilus assembly protein TadG